MNNRQIPAPRNFRLMVVGQIISILGASLLRFALSLYVLDMTGRADIYATLFAISNIPQLLAPIGGAVADRFSRRNLMVLFDFSSSVVVFGLFLLMGAGAANIPVIGTIMVVISIISAMYTPAVVASIPQLVEHQRIEAANGTVQGVQALSGVAAPIIGGILYGVLGIKLLVMISAVSFFLSAVMEIFIQIPFEKRQMEKAVVATISEDIKDGFLYVTRQSFIRKAMILAALLNLLLTPFFLIGGPFILRITMGGSDKMYGVGMGLINAATILGALTFGYFGKYFCIRSLHRQLLLIAVLILPISVSVLPVVLNGGVGFSVALFLGGAVPVAMIMTMLSIYIITKVQKITPNENLGKVMAIIMAVSQCAAPIGQILYGKIFEVFSANTVIPTVLLAGLMFGMSMLAKIIMQNESGETNEVQNALAGL